MECRQRLVDAAHPIDGNFFDQFRLDNRRGGVGHLGETFDQLSRAVLEFSSRFHGVLLCQHVGVRLPATVLRDDSALCVSGRILGGNPPRVWRFGRGSEALTAAVFEGAPVPSDPASLRAVERMLEAGVLHPGAFGGGSDPVGTEIAVVIPVHDDAEGLAVTIDCVRRAVKDGAPIGECIVVDDGSQRPVSIDVDLGVPTRVLRHEHAEGPGAARNTGWHATHAPWIFFADADITFDSEMLERLAVVGGMPTVGIVAPRVRQAAGEGIFGRACAATSSLDLGASPAVVRRRSAVSYVPACALLVARSTLETLNGFEAAMQSGEDVDLLWRAETAGITTRYEPSVIAEHGARTPRTTLQRRFVYGTSTGDLARRHRGSLAPCILRPSSLAIAGLFLRGKWTFAAAVLSVRLASDVQAIREDEATSPFALLASQKLNSAEMQGIAHALCRPYLPITLLGLVNRKSRIPLTLAMVTSLVVRQNKNEGSWDPTRMLWQLADDAAYSAGIIDAAVRNRELGAVLPRRSTFRRRRGQKAIT